MNEFLNGVFRAVSSLLGLVMVAMGGIWILQGLGIAFLNSFMANQIQWSFYGALLALVGLGQIWWSNTRGRSITAAVKASSPLTIPPPIPSWIETARSKAR